MAQQATWQSFLGTSPSIDVTLAEIEDCERHSSHSGGKPLPKGEHRYSLQNVCLDFESGRALDDVTFQVEPGEVVALLGPSGAGKSSAVNVLTGLLRPSAGIVCVDGIDLTQIRRADLQAQ
ncbi:MAG: ATP-binding cassette domain-containing protein, partial [Acidobacteria bacterium]|nr:ATP-binding cassette domain-containing protein [Acidobacteriota bacterium]